MSLQLRICWRLTLWNTLGRMVVLAGFGILVYALLARALYQRIDRSLLSELQELEQDQRMPTQREERLRHWIYEFKEHENISCVVYDGSGQVRERTVELAADSVPPAPAAMGVQRHFSNMSLRIIS